MAKKIRESDIFQGDIFANAKKSADAYLGSLNALQGELKEMLTINKAMLDQSTKQLKTTSDLQKRTNAIQQVTKADKGLVEVEKEKIRVEQELEKLSQQREKTAQQRQRTQVQNRKEEERLAKIKAKNLKLAKQEGQAYSQMSKKLTQLRNKYKNLAVQNKQNTKEGQRLLKTIQQLDGRLKRIDKSVGQSQRNVGNYTSAWGKLGMRLKSVASAFGLMGGIMGAVSLIKNSFGVVVNFDSAIANLGAVSGASEQELEKLRNSALDLSEVTKFTASEVAGLQLELAKLGFTTEQINQSTESILNLASATGTDLASASQIAGSTLRAFNLDASEMDRVASTLGVATSKSALNMEFLQTAMSKVAPVSSAMGFSIEDTTAILGTLANAGFDASSSATATRNILLKLADSGGELAQELGRPVTSLDELAPALAELEQRGIDVGRALEVTDKRSVSAFLSMVKGTETMINLRDGITDVNDELAEMSEKQLDTISGQLALLNSKFQRTILGASDSTGAVLKFKNAIKFLTDNLVTIINIIFKAVKSLIIFKTAQLAVNTIMTTGRVVMIAYKVSVIAMNRGLKSAIRSLKVFNKTMKSNPMGLLIAGLTTAIALLWDLVGATDEASKHQEKLNKAVEDYGKKREQAYKDIDKQSQQDIIAIDKQIAQLKKLGASKEEIAELELQKEEIDIDALTQKFSIEREQHEELNNKRIDALDKYDLAQGESDAINRILNDKKLSRAEKIAKFERIWQIELLGTENQKLGQIRTQQRSLEKTATTQGKIFSQLDKQVDAQWELTEQARTNLELAEQKLEVSEIENKTSNDELGTIKHYRQLISDAQDKLEATAKTRRDAIPIQKEITKWEREIVKILGDQKKGGDKLKDQLKKRLAFEKDLNRVFQERNEILNKQNKEEFERQTKLLDEQIRKELELRQEQAKSTDFVEKGQKVSLENLSNLMDQKLEIEKQSLNDSADNQIKKETFIFNARKQQIERDVKDEKILRSEADQLLLAEKKLFQEKLKLIDQQRLNDITDLETERVKEYDNANEEILKLQNATIDQIDKNIETQQQTERDMLKQRVDAYREFTQQIIQLIDKRSDAEIRAIDKELAESEKREDELRELAQKGTTTAQQSLASEQKRQAELERQREEIEKKKLRRQAILSGLDLLSNKIDNDEPDAVASSIRDIASLIAIIGNLPAFAEGTEYIERGNAPKGKDTIIARVDEGERIMTKQQNRQLTGISNDELTKIAQDYKSGSFNDVQYIKPKQKELHTPFQSTSMILDKFDSLQKTIENKPMLTEVKWDDISQMIVEKVETKNRIENRHKSSKGIF